MDLKPHPTTIIIEQAFTSVFIYFRYRGWHKQQRKVEPGYILVSGAYENCSQGRLYHKMKRVASAEVNQVHSENFLYRPLKNRKSKPRPKTAPAFLNRFLTQKTAKHNVMDTIDDSSNLGQKTSSIKTSTSKLSTDSFQRVDNEERSNSSSENIYESQEHIVTSELGDSVTSDLDINVKKITKDSKKEHKDYIAKDGVARSDKVKRKNWKKDAPEHFIVSQLLAKEKSARQRKMKKLKELHDKKEDGFSIQLSQKAHLLDLLVSKKTRKADKDSMTIAQDSVICEEHKGDDMTSSDDGSIDEHGDSGSVSSVGINGDASLCQEGLNVPLCDKSETGLSFSKHSHYDSNPFRLLERGDGQLSKTFTRRLHETGFITLQRPIHSERE